MMLSLRLTSIVKDERKQSLELVYGMLRYAQERRREMSSHEQPKIQKLGTG